MFGSTKPTEDAKKAAGTPTSGSALNALVKGTVVEGTVRCESDLRVDGTIKGKLYCKAKVIIGPSGVVEGEIRCENAVIEGRFKGNLNVSELLNVRETAEVDGEITTNKLLVQSGARFNVACKMESGTSNGSVKFPESKSIAESKSSDDNGKAATTVVAGGKTEIRN